MCILGLIIYPNGEEVFESNATFTAQSWVELVSFRYGFGI
jgi:hypothetical protein